MHSHAGSEPRIRRAEIAQIPSRAALIAQAPARHTLQTPIQPLATLDTVGNPQLPTLCLQGETGTGKDIVSNDRTQLYDALHRTGGNVTRAARLLGWSRSTVRYRMQRYDIRRADVTTLPEPHTALTSLAGWEHKPVALLAITMHWPLTAPTALASGEPSACIGRWEQRLRDLVAEFGGYVMQYLSSFCLVTFGIPLALERMPQRAVQTALAIRHLTTATAPDTADALSPVVRFAVHLGTLSVDVEAKDPTADLRPLGETLALPVHLSGQAHAGEILVSPQVARQVEEICDVEAREVPLASDQSEPCQAYSIVRIRPRHAPWVRHVSQRLSQFVGRDRELDTLHALLNHAEAGQGQVVGIMGEAGIGKSRFVHEFRRSLTGRRLTYLSGSCYAYGSTTPYLPVLEIVRRNCGITESDSPQTIASKARQGLQDLGMALETWAPYVLYLLAGQADTRSLAGLSPQALKRGIFETLLQMCLQGSQRRPLIFEIEDFHWIDAISEAFLASLVERLADVPILLLVTYRPEHVPAWMNKSYTTQLALTRLAPQESRQLVNSMPRGVALPDDLVQLVLAQANGNPLFLEEFSRALLEDEGHTPLQVPDTVQAVLAARMDRLPCATRRLLQMAAVIGTEVPLSLLQTLASLPESDVLPQLKHLQDAEFLYEARLHPELVYTFKHALTQDVAYQSLPSPIRQQVHQQVAQTLVTQGLDTGVIPPERVAYHYSEAGYYTEAVPYWQQAGRRAYERSANLEAIGHLTQGLQVLARLPETPAHQHQELLLQTTLGAVYTAAKGYAAPEVEQAYARAHTLCQQAGDMRQLFPILVGLWNFYFVRGASQTAYQLGEHLLSTATQAQDPVRQLRAHAALGEIHFHTGQLQQAQTHLQQGISLYTSPTQRSYAVQTPTVACLAYAAWTAWHRGYAEQALQLCQEAVTLARQLSHPLSLAIALHFTGTVYQFRREPQAAQELVAEATQLAREQGFPFWEASGMIVWGWTRAMQGEETAGIAQIQQGLMAFRATGAEIQLPSWLALLAEAYHQAAQPDAGLEVVEEALAMAHKTGERYYEAELYRLQGELHRQARPADLGTQEACFQKALTLARSQQARFWELRAAISLSRLWQRQGKSRAARQLLTALYDSFTEGFETADLQEARAVINVFAGAARGPRAVKARPTAP
jgi:predicted ATPase